MKEILFEIEAVGLREHFDPLAVWFVKQGCGVTLAIADSEFEDYQSRGVPSGVRCLSQFQYAAAPWIPSALISFHPENGSRVARMLKSTGVPRIVMQHGLSDKSVFTDRERPDPLSDFDAVFLIGPIFKEGSLVTYSKKYPETIKRLKFFEIGSPKTDALFRVEEGEREALLRGLGLNPELPTVCYGPTWERFASLETFGIQIIRSLAEMPVNVLLKLHHASLSSQNHEWLIKDGHGGKNWREIVGKLELEYPNLRLAQGQDATPFLKASDLLVSDASGLAYEFLLLDRPIVFFDVPTLFDHYGRDGIHYWGRACGDVAHNIEELVHWVKYNLSHPEHRKDERFEWIGKVSYSCGNATKKAGETILSLIETGGVTQPIQKLGENPQQPGSIAAGTPSTGGQAKVSIIIPTYNRASYLRETVLSFLRQDYPRDLIEIIIVDNNSTDETHSVVLDLTEAYSGIQYLFEARQGVHYARNRAALIASGEILYFTDDDMIADPRLLSEVTAPFKTNPKVGVATGKIRPSWEATPPAWVVRHLCNMWLSLNDLGDDLIISHDDIGAFSCHMAVRRSAFMSTHGFHPENTAGEWLGDGETGLNQKLKADGWLFAYAGRSVIWHRIPPSRMTQDYLNKRMANQGNCDSYSTYRQTRPGEEALLNRIKSYPDLVAKALGEALFQKAMGDDAFHLGMARIHYWTARAEYDLRILQDAKWREMVLRNDWLELAQPIHSVTQSVGRT